jgi:hypothetical protein
MKKVLFSLYIFCILSLLLPATYTFAQTEKFTLVGLIAEKEWTDPLFVQKATVPVGEYPTKEECTKAGEAVLIEEMNLFRAIGSPITRLNAGYILFISPDKQMMTLYRCFPETQSPPPKQEGPSVPTPRQPSKTT